MRIPLQVVGFLAGNDRQFSVFLTDGIRVCCSYCRGSFSSPWLEPKSSRRLEMLCFV